MSAITAAPQLQSVSKAAQALARYDVTDLADVIVRRLEGQLLPQLPGVGRDEEARSIFVELADFAGTPELHENLRGAVVQLIDIIANQSAFENPQIAGDVCFLCASLDAPRAIGPLARMVSRDDLTSVFLPDGEDLRLRALRTLVALLALHKPSQGGEYLISVLEYTLGDPRYKILSLTALLGVWPEQREEFLKLAPLNPDDESRLNLSLQWAGFAHETADLKGRRSSM